MFDFNSQSYDSNYLSRIGWFRFLDVFQALEMGFREAIASKIRPMPRFDMRKVSGV